MVRQTRKLPIPRPAQQLFRVSRLSAWCNIWAHLLLDSGCRTLIILLCRRTLHHRLSIKKSWALLSNVPLLSTIKANDAQLTSWPTITWVELLSIPRNIDRPSTSIRQLPLHFAHPVPGPLWWFFRIFLNLLSPNDAHFLRHGCLECLISKGSTGSFLQIFRIFLVHKELLGLTTERGYEACHSHQQEYRLDFVQLYCAGGRSGPDCFGSNLYRGNLVRNLEGLGYTIAQCNWTTFGQFKPTAVSHVHIYQLDRCRYTDIVTWALSVKHVIQDEYIWDEGNMLNMSISACKPIEKRKGL